MAAKKKTTTKTKTTAAKKKMNKETATGQPGTTSKAEVNKKAEPVEKTIAKEDDLEAEEAAKKAEEKRLADEAAKKAEEKRLADEAAKKAEEKRLADEAAKKAEEKRLADEAAKRAIEIQRVIREIAEREAMEAESQSLDQNIDRTLDKKRKPMGAILAGICFALVISMTVGASINNAKKYYIKHTHAGVEIWKGQFAPTSMEKVLFLKGVDLPEFTEKIYSKQDIFPIPFNYYMDMANDLIKKSLPDFQAILDIVGKASTFATTIEEKEKIALYKTTINEAATNIESNRIILPVEPTKEEIVPAIEGTIPAGAEEKTAPTATEETVPAATEETAPEVTEEKTVPAATEETVPEVTEEKTVPAATEETVPEATEEEKTVPAIMEKPTEKGHSESHN